MKKLQQEMSNDSKIRQMLRQQEDEFQTKNTSIRKSKKIELKHSPKHQGEQYLNQKDNKRSKDDEYRQQYQIENSISDLFKRIRQLRIEIQQMHYAAKLAKIKIEEQKQKMKQISEIERQIRNTRAITCKQKGQHQRIQKMGQSIMNKIKDVNFKIQNIKQQEEQLVDQSEQIKETQLLEQKYKQLIKNIEQSNYYNESAKKQYGKILDTKLDILNECVQTNLAVNQRQRQLQQSIKLQQETISYILQLQLKRPQSNDYFKLNNSADQPAKWFGKQEQKIFAQSQGLDVWEKSQIQNLIARKRDQKTFNDRYVGKIIKIRNNTLPAKGRIVHMKDVNNFLNHSRVPSFDTFQRNKKHSLTEASQIIEISSSQRMRQLQKNKRIKSRWTQFKSQQIQRKNKNVSLSNDKNQEEQQKIKFTDNSILNIYQRLKERGKIKNSNIQVIKLLGSNRRKRKAGMRGIALQRQDGR